MVENTRLAKSQTSK